MRTDHAPASVGGLAAGAVSRPDVGKAARGVSTTAEDVEPFDGASARAALEAACSSVDVDARDAELIRLGENGVFRLRANDVVARVGRSAAKASIAERQLAVARWLAANDVPAIRALDVVQPVIALGRVVTFWESADDEVRYGTTRDLGLILRRLHELPTPNDVELPKLTPFETARARIGVVPIADADRRYLDDRCDDLEAAFNQLTFTPGDVVLHGDANVGNLILDRHDHTLLSDLDSFCIGPRQWDLVLTAMFYRRFGWHTCDEYDAFVSAYGEDILDWDGFDVLADARELLMVAWLAQNARDAGVAEELARRLDTMRSGGSRQGWRPF
jgi:aminoglycoside phosphotransferase